MSNTQYCLRWDSYKQNFSNGFFRLQQDEELVDMTLAADGHLVKVHKTLLALASPYFKEMLKTVNPYHYPVLFLSNVDQEALQYILEYIYNGEVNIDREKLPMFIKTAKALQIKGVDSIIIPPKVQHSSKPVSVPTPSTRNIAANIRILSDKQIEVHNSNNDLIRQEQYYVCPKQSNDNVMDVCQVGEMKNLDFEYNFNQENNTEFGETDLVANPLNVNLTINKDGYVNIIPNAPVSDDINYNIDNNIETFDSVTNNEPVAENNSEDVISNKSMAGTEISEQIKYSISNRHAVELLFNDNIYHPHHDSKTKSGTKCRWRCMDYRRNKCQAFIDTIDGIVKTEYFVHNHVNHASNIRKKYLDKKIYPTLRDAIIKASETKILYRKP